MQQIVEVHYPGIKQALLQAAMASFFELRNVSGLKKKPSTSELLDWLKLLLAEDIPPEALRSQDQKQIVPPLHGALLKNEQDVSLFERLVFMNRNNGSARDAHRSVAHAAAHPPPRRRTLPTAHANPEPPTMSRWIEPVTLKGRHVSLEPLAPAHAPGLAAAAADGELWNLWYNQRSGPRRRRDLYRKRAPDARQPRRPTVCGPRPWRRARSSGRPRFFNVEPAHRRLEIGHTWYAKRVQRTPLNTEAKLLLLGHAFDTLNAIAVEFRTHFMNHPVARGDCPARRKAGTAFCAITRSGRDGIRRDTVVFSILESEWPAVRANLIFLLGR